MHLLLGCWLEAWILQMNYALNVIPSLHVLCWSFLMGGRFLLMNICAQTHIRFSCQNMQMDETGIGKTKVGLASWPHCLSILDPIEPCKVCKNERKQKYCDGQVCCSTSIVSQASKHNNHHIGLKWFHQVYSILQW